MIVLLLVLVGLALGSFVNALVWRLHEGRDWVRERSECTHCHHTLAVRDLIPVVSWVLLRGKCRYCGKAIQDTPLPEIVVPALFVLSYSFWPATLTGRGLFDFICWLAMVVGFVALALFDIKWFLLPDVIVFPLICVALLQVAGDWLVFNHSWHELAGPGIGVLIISGSFFALHYFSKGQWIGFGDVKLGVILGLLAGGAIPALLVLLSASLLGTLVALPLVAAGKANRKSHLPFGPLLIAGMILVELFGSGMIGWYMHLFAA